MKLLLLLLLNTSTPPEDENVFVSKTSTTYHAKRQCHGVVGRKEEVKELSLKKATGTYKKKACKRCYKRTEFQLFPAPFIFSFGSDEE